MSEDWEQCFLPLDLPYSVKPPGVTTCAECEDIIHRDTCFKKEYYNGQMMDTEHWCDEKCHQAWYIKRLKEKGM